MVLLGYVEGTKVYRLYDPCGGKVVVSRDIVFDEKVAWDWSSSSMGEAARLHQHLRRRALGHPRWWRRWRGGANHSSNRAEHS